MDSLQRRYSSGTNEYHLRTEDGYKCHAVNAKELLKQAVFKMTKPPSKSSKNKNKNSNNNKNFPKNKKASGGTLWKKVNALEKLVKAAEKAGEEHKEKGIHITYMQL